MNGWVNIFDYCLLTLAGETALHCWNSQYHRAVSFIFLSSARSVDLLLCTSYIFFYTFTRGLAMAVAVWVRANPNDHRCCTCSLLPKSQKSVFRLRLNLIVGWRDMRVKVI